MPESIATMTLPSHSLLLPAALRWTFATALLLAMPVQAEIFYKWQSDDGVWEYGAHPPPGVDAIEIKTTSVKSAGARTGSAATAATAAAGTSGGTLEVEVEEKRVKAQKHAEYCATASANLEALSSKAVIRRRDAEGNITTISEKERKEEIDKANLAIERYCG